MRLGIFGGTFDPPHLGHLILAEEARYQLNLDRILWLLTPVSPLKTDAVVSPWEQRLELLEAALQDNSSFEVSRIDIDRPQPHYAYESVKILKKEYPGEPLIYLIGGDSLGDLPSWERPGELAALCDQIGVMHRPGNPIDLDRLEKQVPGLTSKVAWVESPLIEISGRGIRKRLHTGDPVRYYLPGAVYQIIQEKGLYRE
ncbi:MAG: nicotinate (nicotinamide) nucleotide adenylyltransferase [Anaerolineales bacterium]|nr:nicotinate (nicotinamide) nucleotide adenylyltransferase [Anaerolineales bacterium]